MPFCRKCGRRLVEYSESCTDCGTSTTAPIINTTRTQGSRVFRANGSAKIAKAMIPEVPRVQIKVITDKPARAVAPVKAVSTVKVVMPKVNPAVKSVLPIKIYTPVKAVEPPKPMISAKHIVKPKKATQSKPAAAFTVAFARPVAGLNVAQSKRVSSPNPVTKPKPVVPAQPVIEPKPIASAITVAPPKPIAQPKPVAAPIKPKPPKPITPAPVYPEHEIIKSKVSIKEDIIANPHDYETQPFDFDLKCPNGHFWPAGQALPISKGKAYCLKCGERLEKPKPKKRRRYRRAYST